MLKVTFAQLNASLKIVLTIALKLSFHNGNGTEWGPIRSVIMVTYE